MSCSSLNYALRKEEENIARCALGMNEEKLLEPAIS